MRDEGLDRLRVALVHGVKGRGGRSAPACCRRHIIARIRLEGAQDLALVVGLEGRLHRGAQGFRLVHQHEITDRGGLLFEQNWNLDAQKQDHGEQEQAEPETFSLGILGVFPPGHEQRVFHGVSLADSAPTRRMKTSCRVGSDW